MDDEREPGDEKITALLRAAFGVDAEMAPEEIQASWRNFVVGALIRQGWSADAIVYVGRKEHHSELEAWLASDYVLHIEFHHGTGRWKVVRVTMPDGTAGPTALSPALTVEDITEEQADEAIRQL